MVKSAEHPLLKYLNSLTAYQDLRARLAERQFRDSERFGMGLPRASDWRCWQRCAFVWGAPILLTNRADRALGLFDELAGVGTRIFTSLSRTRYSMKPCPGQDRPGANAWTFLGASKVPYPRACAGHRAPVVVAPIRAVMTRTIPRQEFLRGTAFERGRQTRPAGDYSKLEAGWGTNTVISSCKAVSSLAAGQASLISGPLRVAARARGIL